MRHLRSSILFFGTGRCLRAQACNLHASAATNQRTDMLHRNTYEVHVNVCTLSSTVIMTMAGSGYPALHLLVLARIAMKLLLQISLAVSLY